MPLAKTVNDVVLFAVELAAWAAFGVWGWHVGVGPWRWVLAVFLPLAVIGLWAVLAAPTSGNRLTDPGLFAFQLGVFLVGAVLLALADRPAWGWTLGVVAVVVVVLDRARGSARA
ncbi:YrdB family protein [Pseudonocardia kunmingensis]|uniref:YrdB family protein n=1 Tax=Pseudonocardia kunmingensis TaxID=630975 RepID=UPI0014793ABB|nr:YrdB family protein [Pseudonocardia kunmingensis]